MFFAAGLLERAACDIFDSALLFCPNGDIILHYHRNDAGWHMADDDSGAYRQGTEIPVVDARFGKVAFLICVDLWDDEVRGRLRAREPDYLLNPFARAFTASHDTEDKRSAE